MLGPSRHERVGNETLGVGMTAAGGVFGISAVGATNPGGGGGGGTDEAGGNVVKNGGGGSEGAIVVGIARGVCGGGGAAESSNGVASGADSGKGIGCCA